MQKQLLSVSLVVALLSGCSTIDPYSGQSKTSSATKGAGIGAVAGAVIGAATASDKDRGKGALIGALGGAAIGGGVGYYMDQQEARLRQYLEGTGVQVQRNGNEIKLIMPGNITFDTGRSELKSQFYQTLDGVATVLYEFDKTRVDVSGHTDSRGSDAYNQKLSEERAYSVGMYLQSAGIASGRLFMVGYGERYPVGDNGSDFGRQQNRRVEINLRAL